MTKFIQYTFLSLMIGILISQIVIYKELSELHKNSKLIEQLDVVLFITNEHIKDLNQVFTGIMLGNTAHKFTKKN